MLILCPHFGLLQTVSGLPLFITNFVRNHSWLCYWWDMVSNSAGERYIHVYMTQISFLNRKSTNFCLLSFLVCLVSVFPSNLLLVSSCNHSDGNSCNYVYQHCCRKISQIFLIRDMSRIPNILWYEYTSVREETRYLVHFSRVTCM